MYEIANRKTGKTVQEGFRTKKEAKSYIEKDKEAFQESINLRIRRVK